MTKFTFGSALAALSLAVPGVVFAQKTPGAAIVIVNRERIFNECNACRAAATTLQGMATSAQQRQQQLSQPLQTEATSIQQTAESIAKQPQGPARTTAETQLQTRMKSFQTRQDSANQELQRLDQQYQSSRTNVTRQIAERLDPIVAAAMKAHEANIAIDSGVTITHTAGLDVTNEVLAQLNTALPSVSVTPLPPQPAATTAPPPVGR